MATSPVIGPRAGRVAGCKLGLGFPAAAAILASAACIDGPSLMEPCDYDDRNLLHPTRGR